MTFYQIFSTYNGSGENKIASPLEYIQSNTQSKIFVLAENPTPHPQNKEKFQKKKTQSKKSNEK